MDKIRNERWERLQKMGYFRQYDELPRLSR